MRATVVLSLALCVSACHHGGVPPDDATQSAAVPAQRDRYPAGTGPSPVLPAPEAEGLVPTVNIAPAVGWPEGAMPTPAPGFRVTAFARGLDHPRALYVLPNGDVLVAESNKPAKPPEGLKGRAMQAVMKKAGAGVASADRISLLRDVDGDGVAETRSIYLQGLVSPYGMALVGDTLYIANTDALVRVPYTEGGTENPATPDRVVALPAGAINHHWTKALAAAPDGRHLYVGVGSNSNVAENGMDAEVDRAAVLEVDPATGRQRVFASGLRNPTDLDFNPTSGALWAVVNERDGLGDDLVPDYLTSVREGAFYGWPYSYFGPHPDPRITGDMQRADLVARAIAPDYALGSHVAPLGLAFQPPAGEGDTQPGAFPSRYRQGAFIGLHGSWNRSTKTGYKLVFVPFANGAPAGPMEDVLGGFVDTDGDARGRPVGVAIDRRGGVLVADDVGNTVWRVVPDASP